MKVIVYKVCELYNARHYSVITDIVTDVKTVAIVW